LTREQFVDALRAEGLKVVDWRDAREIPGDEITFTVRVEEYEGPRAALAAALRAPRTMEAFGRFVVNAPEPAMPNVHVILATFHDRIDQARRQAGR
jgi:hypothetical protein